MWIERLAALRQRLGAGVGVGLLLFAAAVAMRMVAGDVLAPFPFLTFFPAIILTALLGGVRPAIIVTVLSMLTAWYFFIGPSGSWAITPSGVVGLLFFALVAMLDILLIEMLQRVVHRLHSERERAAALVGSREAMFKELQHRVANNMQFVAGLLSMEQKRVTDPVAANVLEQARGRLSAMSRAHRLLYDPTNADRMIGPLIEQLCHDLLEATGAQNIVVRVESPDVRLPIDRVLTLSMVITEALTNAMKHAFADGRSGTIRVALNRLPNDEMLLLVEDNGAGLPADFSTERPRSLGMRILRTLAQQLGGTLTIQPLSPGASLQLRFQSA